MVGKERGSKKGRGLEGQKKRHWKVDIEEKGTEETFGQAC